MLSLKYQKKSCLLSHLLFNYFFYYLFAIFLPTVCVFLFLHLWLVIFFHNYFYLFTYVVFFFSHWYTPFLPTANRNLMTFINVIYTIMQLFDTIWLYYCCCCQLFWYINWIWVHYFVDKIKITNIRVCNDYFSA